MIPINIWPTICFLIRIFLSLAIYKSIESLRPRCPLQTAPVRTEGLFWRPHGCNIAEGNDPPSEAVAEVWHRFFENFSAADFSPHLRRASCTFVRQTTVCPTKVLALRGRAFSPVERLLNRYYGYRPKTDRQDRKEAPNAEL